VGGPRRAPSRSSGLGGRRRLRHGALLAVTAAARRV